MRVMTYNIRGGLGMDGRRSTERISEAILEQNADIVCLQEVHQRLPQSHFMDQPGQLEKFLGLPVTFQANLRLGLGLGGYGVAIISRYPLRTVQNHLLPSVREQRGVLQAAFETPDGPLTVFCTHFGLDSDERLKQASRLAELVSGAAAPVIVCGDFNERADAPGIQTLLAQTQLADADAVQNRLTYPADVPEARIDSIFYSPTLACRNVEVIETQASDHLPVIGEFGTHPETSFDPPETGG